MATLPSSGNGANGTLNKFGVPILNGNTLGGGILMPKLKYRYSVIVTNFGAGGYQTDFTQQVMTAGRPNLQYNRNELHSYNNVMFIPQKPVWQSLEIVLRDDITNNINTLVGQQLQKQMNFYDMSSGTSGENFKFQMQLQTLDGTNSGASLETWYLEGCFLETVNYDSFDYSSSDAVQVTLTISFDNATQETNDLNGAGVNEPGDLASPGGFAG